MSYFHNEWEFVWNLSKLEMYCVIQILAVEGDKTTNIYCEVRLYMVMCLYEDCIQKWMQKFKHDVWELDDVLQPGHAH
jgi:hypothetical protein